MRCLPTNRQHFSLSRMQNESRITYLDILRLVSICAIVLLHVAGSFWYVLEVDTFDWMVTNFYDCATRWGVPVFVMISGALFLDPNRPQPLRKLWAKNILHLCVIILFWGLVNALLYKLPSSLSFASALAVVKEIVFGPVHFWFLFMLLGLYILVPIIRCITANKQAMEYFLVIGLIVNVVFPILSAGDSLPVTKKFFDLQVMISSISLISQLS